MATTPADIIATLDEAINTWAGEPLSLSIRGRTTTYRSLSELTTARSYYANLLRSTGGAHAFQVHRIQAGGSS